MSGLMKKNGIRKTVLAAALALVIFLLVVNATPAYSALPAAATATLTQTSGEVLVMKAGTTVWSNVSAGVNLQPGDRIKTQANSSALIIFFEGSTIELHADTEVSLEELNVARNTGSTSIKLVQKIGETLSRVEKLVDPDRKSVV